MHQIKNLKRKFNPKKYRRNFEFAAVLQCREVATGTFDESFTETLIDVAAKNCSLQFYKFKLIIRSQIMIIVKNKYI